MTASIAADTFRTHRHEYGYCILETTMLLVVLLPIGLGLVGLLDYLLKAQAVSSVVDKYTQDSFSSTYTVSHDGQLTLAESQIKESLKVLVEKASAEIQSRMSSSGVHCSSDGAAIAVNYDSARGTRLGSSVLSGTRTESGSYAGNDLFALDRQLTANAALDTGSAIPTAAWGSGDFQFLPRKVLVGLRVACNLSNSGTASLLRTVSPALPPLEEIKVVQLRGEVH